MHARSNQHPCDPSREGARARRSEARVAAAPRASATGMEPFLAAAAAGLGLWALLLAPLLV